MCVLLMRDSTETDIIIARNLMFGNFVTPAARDGLPLATVREPCHVQMSQVWIQLYRVMYAKIRNNNKTSIASEILLSKVLSCNVVSNAK